MGSMRIKCHFAYVFWLAQALAGNLVDEDFSSAEARRLDAYLEAASEDAHSEELLLLQVQHKLTRSDEAVSSAALASQPLRRAEDREVLGATQALGNAKGLHSSAVSLLLTGRSCLGQLATSASRQVREAVKDGVNMFGEVAMVVFAFIVWFFLMVFCSVIGHEKFKGFFAQSGGVGGQDAEENDRMVTKLPPDPIDAAAARIRDVERKQAQMRKESTLACC
eukprot:TRINITY_DN22365_c0_g1_i1.p1 TRINITY_DN22365_c0_g1~~TRINITY_DN22365_c0_g1_i1.p1  ORF type:complete len:222 (-),score=50.48 TRINITY_DN22365_c0_g1_i1:53-718(-)